MDQYSSQRREAGFSLLELAIAMSLFMILMGVTAQSLVSYRVALHSQNERVESAQDCRSILDQMRNVRAQNPGNFPGAILANWPDGADAPNPGNLPGQRITVDYTNTNANPLEITLTCRWRDIRGHQMQSVTASLLTDR